MSAMFEKFSEMALKDFGISVVKTTPTGTYTFESLFGVSIESIIQCELPYDFKSYELPYGFLTKYSEYYYGKFTTLNDDDPVFDPSKIPNFIFNRKDALAA